MKYPWDGRTLNSSDKIRVARGFLPTDWIADIAYVNSFELSVPFALVPKARARVFTKIDGKIGAAQPAHYRRCLDDLSFLLRAKRPTGWDLERTYAIAGVVYCDKTTEGDVDNLVGTIMDAGNDILWLDDRQVAFAPVLKHVRSVGHKLPGVTMLIFYELFEGGLDPSAAILKKRARCKLSAKSSPLQGLRKCAPPKPSP